MRGDLLSNAESAILAVKPAIVAKFEHMKATVTLYWDLRDRIMDQEYDVGFNEHAYGQDKHYSGKKEAWHDFGSKQAGLEQELKDLESKYGSIELAFKEKKRALLVDTDAILNTAYQILREISGAKAILDIAAGGRPVYGFPPKYQRDYLDNDMKSVPVKCLLWYGRHQINHYSDEPGNAVKELNKYKIIFIANIQEQLHWHYTADIEKYFVPEQKVSMSDEILRLLGWTSFDDFRRDLLQ